ncbi:MAG TPA: WG repeat-containing protein [Flavisolibacter sp.]|nr:WG repeat-containing protein [Flavisolibacter sp.]
MHYLKKLLLSLVLSFCLGLFCSSQSLLIPFREGNLWGYADTNGVIQIKPAFDKANFFNFSKSHAEVFKDGKLSLIDTKGNLLFPFSDSYELYADSYIVKQENKKAIYTRQGKQLHAFEYTELNCSCYYKQYRDEAGKMIGKKNGKYYLVDLNSSEAKEIAKPVDSRTSISGEVLAEAPVDGADLTSIPYPQLQSRDFPKLNGYANLVHCETIYMNQKPVFYVFCAWKNGRKAGYVGQNGVIFYKD